MLRSLPVQKPGDLTILSWHASSRPGVVKGINGSAHRYQQHGTESPNFPYRAYETLRADHSVFSALFAYTYAQPFNAIVANEAETVTGGFVDGGYFAGLGVPPAAGRLLGPEDDAKGAPPAVVLSWAYWQRRFNGDPAAVGQSILLNGLPFTIAGVTARGFFGVDPQTNPLLFLPIHAIPALSPNAAREERSRFLDDHFYWIEMMGRLQPGVSPAQAQAATRARFSAFAAATAQSPKDAEVLPELSLEQGGAGLDSLRRQYSKPLYVLMTMVALILAIACANLANLLLARAAARRREMAVRLSLGAGRWRIVRQMLTESMLLSVAGGALGIPVALAGIRLITWLLANGRPDFTLRAAIDWPVLVFTFALAVLAGIVFGLAPALQATRVDVTPALKESRTHGRSGGHGFRLGHILIVTQIAVSTLLVIAAGLFVRTLVNLHSIDVGFNSENLLLVGINGRQAGYRDAALAHFYAGLTESFRQIPGVRSVSATAYPLVARYVNGLNVVVPGRTPQPGDPSANIMSVDPAFLSTMQIPVLAGRDLVHGDLAAPQVAVVTPKFASVFFAGQDPIGRQFSLGGGANTPLLQIVGIARPAHYNSLQEQEEQPVIYLPYTQDLKGLNRLYFMLRTAGPPATVVTAVRHIVHDASPSVSISEISTQSDRMEQTISQERTFANLGACFAALALVIACVGLYGAMSYTVARRTGEIGIRMALGAQRAGIVWMVLRQVLALTAAGLLIGYGAARWAARLVESFLFGLKSNDPLVAAAAVAGLLLAALSAGYLPAWKASRIDPASALRNE
jgi:predicted permease